MTVPTIRLEGDASGALDPDPSAYRAKFSGKHSRRTVERGIGYTVSQEAPEACARAIVDVDGAT